MSNKPVIAKEQIIEHITPVVDKAFPVERFAKMAAVALMEVPALQNASKVSIVRELIKCARKGLVPDGHEAAIVPFKGQARLMPMVSGLIKLARQSGEIKSLVAFLVREGDGFEVWVDENGQHVRHTPKTFSNGDPIGVYAVARLKNGETEVETMSLDEIKAVEKTSRAGSSPWKGDFWGEMARKSVIRRLLKRLPQNPDLGETLKEDNEFHDFTPKKPEVKPTSSRLRDAIETTAEEVPEDDGEPPVDEEGCVI